MELNQIPCKARRIALEISAIAALSFTLSTVLAANSDDLRNYRAYFLSTAKDCAVVSVLGLGLYRALSGLYGTPQKTDSRDSESGRWN
ncbi:MAG: hypothetical protein KME10_23475 [Plectolyngbya sp. WJT66-NPBG17]|nr:hypothetical protein [Plectolyngbya sp. WJT66-NPBG17]